jgi:hypothetical protein
MGGRSWGELWGRLRLWCRIHGERARARWRLESQRRPWAHSSSRVRMNRSTVPLVKSRYVVDFPAPASAPGMAGWSAPTGPQGPFLSAGRMSAIEVWLM